MTEHDGIVLPLPNASLGAQDRKEKKTRPAPKDKAASESIPKTTLSSNRKAIEELKAALKEEGQSTESNSVQTSHKKEKHPIKKKAKASADKETPATDGGHDEVELGENPSPKAGKGRARKAKRGRTPLSRRVSSKVKNLDPKTQLSSASEIRSSISSSTETPTQAGEGDSQARSEKKSLKIHFRYSKDKPGCKRPLKTSKAARPSLIRKHFSNSKNGTAEGLNRQLMAVLQANKLSPEDRKLFMSHLRHSLLSGSIKTSDPRKQGLVGGQSTERPKISRVSKTTKKTGSTSSHNISSKESMKYPYEQLKEKRGMTAYEIMAIDAADLDLVPIEKPQPPVPNLAYGLERVLFNPGVYHLRDPRSRVFNFDPYLESIMPVADFDFNALKEYITSSRDETLLSAAAAEHKKYTGSTSSMTSALAHFHFLLSQWRPVNTSNLSQGFPDTLRTFTQLQRAPSAIFLRWRNGTYAIDADKEFDTANILMMLGKSMEKLLTLPTRDFEKYRKENSDQISADERNEAESFHYTTMGDFLMRSQLDAYDPRIPGTGMFDLKTRAVVSIRMDARNYHNGLGYEIRSRHGEFESYEREYYDMIRAAFLKYSLQVRMGRMDGIFVAFHNTERIFGFQYISLSEMDLALHGQEDLTIGDSEFKLSLELLNRVLDRATAKFPEQSLRLFFETRDTATPFMYIFAEPVTEDDIQKIQDSKKAEIEEYERTVLGIQREPTPEEIKNQQEEAEWEELQAKVEDSMDNDELETLDESEIPDEISDDGAVVDSDRLNSSAVDEGHPGSADRSSDEHLFALDSEVKHANEDDAEFGKVVEKHIQHDEASEAGDDELGLQDTPYSGVEGKGDLVTMNNLDVVENHRTDESLMDALALNIEAGHIREDGNEAVTNLKTDENVAEEAVKIADTDHQSKYKGHSRKSNTDLLAMTLTIRNKVNGVYVVRPENMGSNDSWSVEYALAEVPKPEQSQILYQKTQRRRALILKRDKKDAKTNFHQSYSRKLTELSSQGRKWRQEQNEIDRAKPVTVLGDQIEGSQS
jgi:hypothetical protein